MYVYLMKYLLWLIIVFIGLCLLSWGIWGGKIICNEVPELERGLGLNPPDI
jgi:hypothetical protein